MAKRGLASADEKTRQRVARMGGIARGKAMRNAERGFFSEIGRTGDKSKKEQTTSPLVEDWRAEY